MTDTSLYDTDIVAWADRQVEELRRLAEAGVTNAVDWANVIEEIESVGRSERHAVESLIINALTHLLKIVGDPDSLSARAWRQEIITFLDQATRRVTGSARAGLDLEELWPGRPRACSVEPQTLQPGSSAGRPDELPLRGA